jgi:phospholipid/cholesterol/gamma-HCH transport system permease protein
MAATGQGGWETTRDAGVWTLRATGVWTLATAPGLDGELRRIAPERGESARLDLSAIDLLDTAGAWLLFRLRKRLRGEGFACDFTGVKAQHQGLFEHVFSSREQPELERHRFRPLARLANRTGYHAIQALGEARDLVGFFGQIDIALARALVRPRRLKIVSVVSHMEQVGLNAMPIVGLLSFLIGVVLAFQGADQLRRFGAEIFTVNLLGISFLREIGVLMTSIIIAGRSGSAFTAQIGTMQVNEEVDAMRAMGLDPVDLLVLPRLIALALVLPLLAFYSDICGLVGGALMSLAVLDISIGQYLTQLNNAVPMWSFWIGILKAPVFAFLIAMVGCYNGLKVAGSAESVGRMTTRAVVQSIFLVIVVDAVFSILFSFLGI